MKRLLIAIGVVLAVAALPGAATAQNATDNPVASSTPSVIPEKPLPDSPSTFGTFAVSYYEVPANSFQPWNSSQTYTSEDFGRGRRWATTSATDLIAPLRLPSGAKLTYLELDYLDNNASAATYGELSVCSFTGTSCSFYPNPGVGTADCTLTGFICSGIAAASSSNGVRTANLTASNIVVDNFFKSYSLLAEPNATDGTEKVGGMIVGYVLQVSPAPGVATFADVPTSSPQFRFVEALVAAGITAGCGGGNYCPNDPITRGQMAVFLASALGLQWN
jgi:hypothetical protein